MAALTNRLRVWKTVANAGRRALDRLRDSKQFTCVLKEEVISHRYVEPLYREFGLGIIIQPKNRLRITKDPEVNFSN